MKKLDHRTLKYIAKAYGKRFDDGGEAIPDLPNDPISSDLPPSGDTSSADPSASVPDSSPPPGYDGSPDANPNVSVSPETVAQADLPPTDSDTAPSTDSIAPPPQSNPYTQAGIPDIEGALKESKAANIAGAKAQADQGQAEVAALKAGQDAIAVLPSANDIAAQFKKKDDVLYQAYVSNKLDPKRYVHSLNTAQKIGAGIGLILGGVGSGLTGQPNLAAKMIEDNINRDVDAQKNSQDQTMNLWKMNREEYGNDLAANLQTQNQLLLGTKSQLMQAASAAKGPLAQANAQGANALIDQKIAENRFKLSLMSPTSDTIGLDPAKKVQFLVPPEKQQKVFDEIDAAQNTARNAPSILNAFDRAAEEVRPTSGGTHTSLTAFVPGIDSPGQKAFHAGLGPTFSDIEHTVRQAAMDNMFKNTTPQFGDNASTIASKRKSVIDYMTAKSSAPTASGFGINLGQYPSTNVRAALPPQPGSGQSKQAAKSSGPEIRYSADGRAFVMGPNGVPVPYQGKK